MKAAAGVQAGPRRIRVVVADADAADREALLRALRADPGMEVAGVAVDGRTAIALVKRAQPDLALMKAALPDIDGFEATRTIMEDCPLPIVICSETRDPAEVSVALRAMEAGAVSCVPRPRDAASLLHLLNTMRLMAEVKVVRRWPRRGDSRASTARGATVRRPAERRVVGIGASTGGPPLLQAIIASLPKDFGAPILVVQHISPGFLPGMVDWLGQTTGMRVLVGSHGVPALPGHVYLAPDDFHMGIMPCGHLLLSREGPENGLRPSVSFLFRSLAASCGAHGIGVLLSGMGKDGAAELGLMKERGAVTIAQDRESSTVHGMPGEAIARGAAKHILPADQIADVLCAFVTRHAFPGTGGAPQ